MAKLYKFGLVLLLAITLVTPVCAGSAVDDKAVADESAMTAILTRLDAGELSIDQTLLLALEQDISFSVIIAACEARNIPLSSIITAAAAVGISSEVVLAKMADAGVTSELMSVAIADADAADAGLGYTKAKHKKPKPPKKPKKPKPPVSPSQL